MTICAAGAAVKNVADDVQLVYRQTGDEIRERHDEPVGNAGLDHAVDDAFKIPALVGIVLVGVNELFDNIGIFLRQTGSHLDAGIFVRRLPADGHKTVDRHAVPGIGVRCGGKLPLGVIEQPGERIFLLLAEKIAEAVVDLVVDRAGGVFEDREKYVYSPWMSLMKCSVVFGSSRMACSRTISAAVAGMLGKLLESSSRYLISLSFMPFSPGSFPRYTARR